jgi:hypothetical protein
MRAGDGNRTRTISLGICAIRASTWPHLRSELSVSDCENPLFALVNGPLMARRRGHVERRPSVSRPDIFPSCCITCERPWVLATAGACRWPLLLLSARLTLRSPALLPSARYRPRSPACRSRPHREGTTGALAAANRRRRARTMLSCCFGCVLVAVTGRRKLPTRAS